MCKYCKETSEYRKNKIESEDLYITNGKDIYEIKDEELIEYKKSFQYNGYIKEHKIKKQCGGKYEVKKKYIF